MSGGTTRPLRPAFVRADDGVAAVEFAMVLPVMLLLVLGGYQLGEAVSAYRKVTLTANTVANLISRNPNPTASDVTAIMNASTQIMAPFATSASSMKIVLTEFTTDGNGKTTVTWSQTLNGTALTAGSQVTLPANVAQNGTSIILSNVSYNYTPATQYLAKGGYNMSSQTYTFPRSVASIPTPGN